MLNIHKLIPSTSVEGPGRRFAIWFQGCNRRCSGCMATDTWSHRPVSLFDEGELASLINSTGGIEGVTVLGGEPFEQSHELSNLLTLLNDSLSTIVFTGFKIEELHAMNEVAIDRVLSMTDVLVDGEYVESLHDLSRPMVGSTNQRFHFLTNRYSMSDFPANQIEIRLTKDGSALINGNGHIGRISLA